MQLNCSRQHLRSLDSYHAMFIIGLVLDSPQLQLTELMKHVEEDKCNCGRIHCISLIWKKIQLLCKNH